MWKTNGLEYFQRVRFENGATTGTPATAGSASAPANAPTAPSGGPATGQASQPVTMEALQTMLAPVLKLEKELPGMVVRLTHETLEKKQSDAAKLAAEQQAVKDRANETETQTLKR